MDLSCPDKSKLSRLGSCSKVLFDQSSGKRTLETHLTKGVPALSIFSIMEQSKSTDCQDEIESGLFDRDGFGQWPSEKGAGGIAVGCAAMNDMVRNKHSINANLPRNSSMWHCVKCVNKSYLVRWCHSHPFTWHVSIWVDIQVHTRYVVPTMSLQFQRQKKSPISYESTSRILLWL